MTETTQANNIAPADSTESHRGIWPLVKASGIASLAVSAGLTTLATAKEGNLPGAVASVGREVVDILNPGEDDHNLSMNVDAGWQRTGIGDIELPGIGIAVDGQIKGSINARLNGTVDGETPLIKTRQVEIEIPGQVKTEIKDVRMEWARLFSEDPNAEKLSNAAEIQAVLDRIEALEQQGYSILSVEVQGFASMEDDTPDTHPELHNPGFGIPSQKNVELANTRGVTVKEILQPAIQAETGTPLEVGVRQGEEIEDPVLAEDITEYASEHGLDLVKLVKTYNRNPDSLPAEAVRLLDGLEDDRFVRVFIKAVKPSYKIEISVPVKGEIPIDGNDEVNQSDEKSEKDGGNIILIGMLVPLAMLARKRSTAEDAPVEGSKLKKIIEPLVPSSLRTGSLQPRGVVKPFRQRQDELFRNVSQRSSQTNSRTPFIRQMPRNHNFSKKSLLQGGRRSRSSGGDRTAKRQMF